MTVPALKPREVQVINAAVWAHTVTPNGHYLCSPGQISAAKRMIDRGYLTKAKRTGDVTFGKPDDWLVVVLTKRNISKITNDLGTSPPNESDARAKTGRPRAEDRGKTLMALQPWVTAKMSRASWYRRKKSE